MLNFEEFQEFVQLNLPEFLPEEQKGVTVNLNSVMKNNGVEKHGTTVKPENSNIAPNIYLDGYYEQYKEGESLDVIMSRIQRVVMEHMEAPDEFADIAQKFQDFDFVKDRVVMVAVNSERNAELLTQVPHQEREDLSLIYKVMLGNDADGMASITVRNEHLEMWGKEAEEIHELAMKNTREILPVTVQSMNEVMKEMFSKDGMPDDMMELMFEDMPMNQQMFIISNQAKVNGAASMFYEDALSGLAEKIGSDLYILPSSVHEVIAVSTEMGDPEYLSNMVKEVNGTQVSNDEQLSDHVYKFDAVKKTLSLADTTMEQLKKAAGAENEAVEMDAPAQENRARRHR